MDEFKLENYLEGEICCREERQYALFLYMILMQKEGDENKEDIKNRLGIDGKIIDVYYEAAFMRDFHKSEGKKFNKKLQKFCMNGCFNDSENTEMLNVMSDYNVGAQKGRGDLWGWLDEKEWKAVGEDTDYDMDSEKIGENCSKIEINRRMLLMQYMMNVKPDLVVVYQKREKETVSTHVKAFECKYESPEDYYSDLSGIRTIPQTWLQEAVLKFLFGEGEKIKEKLTAGVKPRTVVIRSAYKACIDKMGGVTLFDDNYVNEGVCIVRFGESKKNKEEILITISELQEFYNKCKTRCV